MPASDVCRLITMISPVSLSARCAPQISSSGAQRADNDTGEIMAISLRQSEAGMAIVYQQWRGAAFDPASAANWPAPPETIEARARLLQAETMLTLAD